MEEDQVIKNAVRECCKMINAHMQGSNPYDSLLVLQIKEHFGIEPNEGLELPCKTPGQ
jgi:hypothetical protein